MMAEATMLTITAAMMIKPMMDIVLRLRSLARSRSFITL